MSTMPSAAHTPLHATSPVAPGGKRPIRVGAIGTGLAMEKLHWPALGQIKDRVEVVAFAEKERATAEQFSGYSGVPMSGYVADYEPLLKRDDVEAVVILLPIPLLYDAARTALQAGKHVLCEKTPGVDLEQGRAFLKLEQEFPDRTLLVAENFFYRDDLRLARRLLDEGAIGKLNVMVWRMASQYVPRASGFSSTRWRQRPEYRGGPHLDGGVHMVAQIRLLCGDVRYVHGLSQHANATMGGPSTVTLNMEFVSGAIGNYTSIHPDIAIPSPQDRGLSLYGSDAVMTFGSAYGEATRTVTVHRPKGGGASGGSGSERSGGTEAEEHRVEQSDGGYLNEWLNFYDAVVYGEPVVGTVAQSWLNMQVVLRGLDASESHTVMDLAQDAPVTLSEKPLPLWKPRGAEGLFDGLPCKVSGGAG
ncbi:MAG TPA: Gfo/Idh/MocA family oxidoreductase [Chloroflexota bacterium]|nr:Gfo/Idh/MocA family oxidoreductase [Chloroflexota bacterium]